MQHPIVFVKRSAFAGLAALTVFSAPALTYAAGVDHPTGSAAKAFSYNQDDGRWENQYYYYDPSTGNDVPRYTQEYTYNETTGAWDTSVWEYHPNADKYEKVQQSVATPPAGAVTHGGPKPKPVATTPQATTTKPTASSQPGNSSAAATQSSATSTNGAGGTNQSDSRTQNSAALNSDGSVNLTNNIAGTAASGDALSQNNYSAGDATTGDSASIANVINMLQSNAGLGGSNFTTFSRDIQGDVNGDMLIDPSAFVQPAGSSTSLRDATNNNVAINNSANDAIQNNIAVGATSGNATLDGNYSAGNATSGNAEAVANVMNLINSTVAANQSFLGVVNIYGNYSGNILVPQDTLDSLLGSNGNNSTNTSNTNVTNNSAATTDSEQNITNNTNLSAASGTATSADNYKAGNTTSGNALTNLTILNLTGHKVDAANSLLVFVNVLGTWVGVIMDAPTGATAAALSGGGNGSTNSTETDVNNTGNANLTSKQTITNNITSAARSGNASSTNNYNAGNVTSGKASASANIANIMNSSFNLSNWFGILFINVFGNWIGNFGTAKPAVTTTAATATPQVFSFSNGAGSATTPSSTLGLNRVAATEFASPQQYQDFQSSVSSVLAAHKIVPGQLATTARPAQDNDTANRVMTILPLALGVTGISVIAGERIRAIRRGLSSRLRR